MLVVVLVYYSILAHPLIFTKKTKTKTKTVIYKATLELYFVDLRILCRKGMSFAKSLSSSASGERSRSTPSTSTAKNTSKDVEALKDSTTAAVTVLAGTESLRHRHHNCWHALQHNDYLSRRGCVRSVGANYTLTR